MDLINAKNEEGAVIFLDQVPPLYFLPRNKLAWAHRQRECREPREQNCRCRYGSSYHTTWWTPRGSGARGTQGCLTRHLITSDGGSQNHLKSYLQVPKTVTREEAYKGGQKLQTYISPRGMEGRTSSMFKSSWTSSMPRMRKEWSFS